MTAAARATAATAICRALLGVPEVRAARSVAAYLSLGTEPSTTDLLDALTARGTRILLPVLRDDLDLDWADYDGSTPIAQDGKGVWTPGGPRLGVDAVKAADVVVVPALAVDEGGRRLGRGGGSYDRALARVGDKPVVALLYDGEVLPSVPTEGHDRPVTAVVTPGGVHRCGGS